MGSAERRERERAEVRTAILDAARAIMSERGYDGLTMRSVADRIEYTAAAIYKHFADREQLVRELCANDFYAFAQLLRNRPGVAKSTSADPYSRLRAIAQGYTEFALSHPEQFRVMFLTPKPPHQPLLEKGNPDEDAYANVVEAVADAQAKGCLAGLDPDLVAQTCWAAMHGVVSLEVVLCGEKQHIDWRPIAQRTETMLETVIGGLEALAMKRATARRRPSRTQRRKR